MHSEQESCMGLSSMVHTEDWWAVWLGLFIFLLGLGTIGNMDLLGWVVKTNTWTDASKALTTVTKDYGHLSGIMSLFLTYLFFLIITTAGAAAMKTNIMRFIQGFTIIFWLTYGCWMLGSNAYIAATPDVMSKFNIGWSLHLTGEAGFIIALIVGLLVGNIFPGLAKFLEDSAKPEWFIKTGIVILGAAVGIQACEAAGLAKTVLFRGLCAILEAYLIYWPVVYFVARRYFKFTPEWAAPLASGISICGVAASIATGGAIRSRPVIPCIVSSIIIIFVVIELLILPWFAQAYLYKEPMVAGAWMGLAVKSDGGAVASGAITDALIRAKAITASGIHYKEGWILMAATTTKLFIDIFIGIWSFILAIVWSVSGIGNYNKSGATTAGSYKVSVGEIWERFPKFVIGYVLTFAIMLFIGLNEPALIKPAKAGIVGEANTLRGIFFALTFFSIGLVTNVRRLCEAGMGKLAGVYMLCLFGFIIWVGLFISWVFFHGIMPPIVAG